MHTHCREAELRARRPVVAAEGNLRDDAITTACRLVACGVVHSSLAGPLEGQNLYRVQQRNLGTLNDELQLVAALLFHRKQVTTFWIALRSSNNTPYVASAYRVF